MAIAYGECATPFAPECLWHNRIEVTRFEDARPKFICSTEKAETAPSKCSWCGSRVDADKCPNCGGPSV